MNDTTDTIKQQIQNHPVLLFMKGTPQQPRCGFSAQTVGYLIEYGVRFAYVDIMEHPQVRQTLPEIANWPTFPQLWVDGKLVGGCDIVTDMHQRGTLSDLLSKYSEETTAG